MERGAGLPIDTDQIHLSGRGYFGVRLRRDRPSAGWRLGGEQQSWLGVPMRAADAKLLLHMKHLKDSGEPVRRGGAQSTIWMRMIIGEVVFSQNLHL